jgi:hypothetical protein
VPRFTQLYFSVNIIYSFPFLVDEIGTKSHYLINFCLPEPPTKWLILGWPPERRFKIVSVEPMEEMTKGTWDGCVGALRKNSQPVIVLGFQITFLLTFHNFCCHFQTQQKHRKSRSFETSSVCFSLVLSIFMNSVSLIQHISSYYTGTLHEGQRAVASSYWFWFSIISNFFLPT